MTKTKKVIFVVLSALVCVFSLSFNFFKVSDNTLKVKADTSISNYVFDGSPIYTPIKRGNVSSERIVDFLLVGLRLEFDTLNQTLDISFATSTGFWNLNRLAGDWNFAYFDFSGLTYSDIPYSSIFTGSSTGDAFYRDVPYSSWDGSSTFGFACYGSSTNIGEIIGVRLGNITTSFSNFSQSCNYISYFDSEDNFITFYFRTVVGGGVEQTNFIERTYYFLGADDFSDNQIYNQGYQEGLLDNQTNIYDNGYKAGNAAGYSNGYNAGLNDSNQYSFFNLFGAVLDAPISTLTGLLNFELFGINLLTLFTGLLTLAVILLVLRLIRGGK